MSLDEEQLVEKFRERILYFGLRHLRDRHLAEEVAQESILILIQALREGRIREESKIASYTFGIAANLVRRRLRRRAEERSRNVSEEKGHQVPWLEDPEAALLSAESRREVRSALELLEPSDREILEMSLSEPIPLDCLAEKMGISYSALRKRKSRALARLRKALERVTKSSDLTLTD